MSKNIRKVTEKIGGEQVQFYPQTHKDAVIGMNSIEQDIILGGVYDVSAKNSGATFASLSALLSNANLSTLIPTAVRKGGMSIRFVQTSDNKYVQYFLTKNQWSASEADWEKMNLEEEVSQLGQEVAYIDLDKVAPLPSGYYSPSTARAAVPSKYRKYGIIIQYRVSALSMRVEQFIDDSNGYAISDNAWETLYPKQDNNDCSMLRGIIQTNKKWDNGQSVVDTGYCCAFLPVFENTTYLCTDTIESVEYFCGPTKINVSRQTIGNLISHAEIDSDTFTTPAGCSYVGVNFTKRAVDLFDDIYIVPQYNINIQDRIRWQKNKSIVALQFTQYIESSTSYKLSTGAREVSSSYDSAIFKVSEGDSYVIRNKYGQDSPIVGVLFFSDTPGSDSFISSVIKGTTYNESDILVAPTGCKYIVVLLTLRSSHTYDEVYFVPAYNVNPLIARRSGPCFAEFRNMNANDNTRVSVGMLGNTEANLSYNMDYRTGVHKAYDPTKAAIWLALNGAGGAFQYSGANQPTNGDIWESDGYRYALWFSPYQLAVNTDMNDPKGTAAIWGKRRNDQATFAGHTDCIIEGNRVKGTSGIVFLNAYNNGKVIIANGGGRILLGGVADDNTTRVQITGDVKATQYKLSDLNVAPSSSTDTGIKGEIRVTENYIYVCVATNTWVRAALETW